MIKFFLILIVVMSLIIMLTLRVMGSVLEGKLYKYLSRGVLIFDVGAIFCMSLGYSLFHGSVVAAIFIQLIAIVFMFQLLCDGLMLLFLLFRKVYCNMMAVPVDEKRRKFLKGAVLIPAVVGASSLYAGLYARKHNVVNNYDIQVKSLAENVVGFRIAQLSDVHLGPFMDVEDLRGILKQTADLKPDILVITGDLFDDKKQNQAAMDVVNSFVSVFPKGIVFCRGNHEHLRGMAAIEMMLEKTDIKELVNENYCVLEGDTPLYLAGADYPMDREHFDSLQRVFTAKAVENIPQNAVTILLAHHPDFVESAAEYNVRLVLSGHTHGGQIGCMGMPLVPPVFKYMRGMYQVGDTQVYVHSGNGSWFPYRLGCPPEIAVFRLIQG